MTGTIHTSRRTPPPEAGPAPGPAWTDPGVTVPGGQEAAGLGAAGLTAAGLSPAGVADAEAKAAGLGAAELTAAELTAAGVADTEVGSAGVTAGGVRSADAGATRSGAVRPECVSAAPRRLAWLDGLRGLAVLCVIFEHMSYLLFSGVRPVIGPWFSFGTYGVLVFFLVSGYIVPASLERRGSVRGFWTGRFLRLYPPLALALVATVVLALTGVVPFRAGVSQHPVGAILAHATMLQDLLNVPNALNVLWTLSYEMMFYLLVTALFTVGLHRRSSAVAIVLGTAGLVAGGVLPTLWLSRTLGTNTVVFLVAAVLVAGLAGVTRDRTWARRAGALLLTALVLGLVTVDSRIPWWQDMIVLSTMFSGTAVYRAEQRQTRRRSAIGVAVLVPALSVAAALVWDTPASGRQWAIVVLAAWATFGVAMLARARRVPRPLRVLGTISYSLYLLHPLALDVFQAVTGDRHADSLIMQSGWALAIMTVLVVAGLLLHRYVECPAQRLGRRLTHR